VQRTKNTVRIKHYFEFFYQLFPFIKIYRIDRVFV
jgi:hypothetical protein